MKRTARAVDNRKRRERMKQIVAYLRGYMNTYDQQPEYLDYPPETLVNDVLYGLGVALSDEYKYGEGFEKFKSKLLDHLSHRPVSYLDDDEPPRAA